MNIGAALYLDELAGVELLTKPVHVVERARDDLPGGIGQGQRQVVAAASRADRLVGAEEERPADGLGGERGDGRKARHVEDTSPAPATRVGGAAFGTGLRVRTSAMAANTIAIATTVRAVKGSSSTSAPSATAISGFAYA